jgi:hypothetical protein
MFILVKFNEFLGIQISHGDYHTASQRKLTDEGFGNTG